MPEGARNPLTQPQQPPYLSTQRDWFINDYMISNETLYHKNPVTGEPQMISLGWMDDSMTMNGPTEEDSNYIADTGFTTAEMQAQVDACAFCG